MFLLIATIFVFILALVLMLLGFGGGKKKREKVNTGCLSYRSLKSIMHFTLAFMTLLLNPEESKM